MHQFDNLCKLERESSIERSPLAKTGISKPIICAISTRGSFISQKVHSFLLQQDLEDKESKRKGIQFNDFLMEAKGYSSMSFQMNGRKGLRCCRSGKYFEPSIENRTTHCH